MIIFLVLHMRFFNEAPLVRLLLPLILGIVSAVYFLNNVIILLICSCISIMALIALICIKPHTTAYKYTWMSGLAINSALFFFSAQLTLNKSEIRSVNHFSKHVHSGGYVIAQLTEPSVEKEKTLKCLFIINRIVTSDGIEQVNGKALVYIQKDTRASALKYGDEIVFRSDLREIAPPQNPEEFNYKRYLSFQNIFHQQYIKQEQWKLLNENAGNRVMSIVYDTRNSLLLKLNELGLKGQEYAVGAALILGYSDKLDPGIISAYAGTGTLHVLSVSGLHVGLVYVVFNFLLRFIERFKQGKIIKGISIIMLLWAYAALTGFSPAVLRAATMFSFVVLGRSINRDTNIYNTLAVSCFVLLLFDPFLIFDVGFQLSYLAVAGIIFLQPLIYNWWHTTKWLPDQVWKIISVSIAAQLATLPLCFFYFHQFPNYFLFSNLIVIPLSTLVIYNGILVFVLSNIPWLGTALSKLLNYLLAFLNSSVKFMEQLPYALWQGISISFMETGLIYLLIISGIVYLLKRKYIPLVVFLITGVILLSINLYERVGEGHQQKIIVYNIPHLSAIDLVDGNKNYFIADRSLTTETGKVHFYILPNRWSLGIAGTSFFRTDSLQKIRLGGKVVVHITDKDQVGGLEGLKADCVILSSNCELNLVELAKTVAFDLLVFDSSNSASHVGKWIQECRMLHKKYYNVATKGAFIMNI
ncbi:MAG: ComEC family competence protein [Bacteroidetes bacterium]|nr:ComEC family competence protein [Bacteroidota bacterium]